MCSKSWLSAASLVLVGCLGAHPIGDGLDGGAGWSEESCDGDDASSLSHDAASTAVPDQVWVFPFGDAGSAVPPPAPRVPVDLPEDPLPACVASGGPHIITLRIAGEDVTLREANPAHWWDLGYFDASERCVLQAPHAERGYCAGAIVGIGACAGASGAPPCLWFELTKWPDVYGQGSYVDADGRSFELKSALVQLERWDADRGTALHATFSFSLADGRSAEGTFSVMVVEQSGCLL